MSDCCFSFLYKKQKICYIYLQDALYPFVYTSIQITQYNIYMIVLLKLKVSFNDNVKMSPSYVAYIFQLKDYTNY